MSGRQEPGVIQAATIRTARERPRVVPPVARCPLFRIVYRRGEYQADVVGTLRHTQTHEKNTLGRRTSAKDIVSTTFQELAVSPELAATFSDSEIVEAALAYCRAQRPTGHQLSVVTDALTALIGLQHGIAIAGEPGDLRLDNIGAFVEAA